MRGLLLALLVLPGCLPEEATDPGRGPADGRVDARSGGSDARVDGGEADAAVGDAGDAGAADAGAADAAPADGATPPADAAFEPVVDFVCPGAPACAGPGEPALWAGAAAVPFSDLGFEHPLPAYLRSEDCNEIQPEGRCGVLTDDALRNCGTDRLCPGDEGYEAPDADGTEGDLAPDGTPLYDYFRDCGFDQLCPGDAGYPGPDEGEGNGRFDGLWLAGFNTNRPAAGVRDHAWARTVALQQGGTLVTLTVLDAVGLFYDQVELIREEARALLAAEAPELEPGFMLVASTHSHEVPDTMGQWGGEVVGSVPSRTGVVPRYIAHLRSQAARSIADAVLDLRPARLVVGQASTGVEGFIRDSRPPFIVDDTLGVARLIGPRDETIATLVNWGNHPESLGSANNFITSDFPGALRQALEDGLPAEGDAPAVPGLGGVAIFVQGMVGGLMTPLGVPVRGADGALLPEPSSAQRRHRPPPRAPGRGRPGGRRGRRGPHPAGRRRDLSPARPQPDPAAGLPDRAVRPQPV
ncbi:MAG: hypothetical protein R3F43_08085 [bacterium]